VQAFIATCGDVNPDPEVAEDFECGPDSEFDPATRNNTDLSSCCIQVTPGNMHKSQP
jgi:hypothetical protein